MVAVPGWCCWFRFFCLALPRFMLRRPPFPSSVFIPRFLSGSRRANNESLKNGGHDKSLWQPQEREGWPAGLPPAKMVHRSCPCSGWKGRVPVHQIKPMLVTCQAADQKLLSSRCRQTFLGKHNQRNPSPLTFESV